jgi:hypothetical protein
VKDIAGLKRSEIVAVHYVSTVVEIAQATAVESIRRDDSDSSFFSIMHAMS